MAGMTTSSREAELRNRRQVLVSLLFFWVCRGVSGQVKYSIAEELKRGSVVGNIANDLGLNVRQLSDKRLRVVSSAGNEYFTLNAETGNLHVNNRIDREEMCGEASICVINFEVFVQNPLNVFHVEVHIQDINDNPPNFLTNSVDLEIVETTLPGARISLGNARDPDIGVNALQGYRLTPNPYFILEERLSSDGNNYADLVLENLLDREKESLHLLVLTASDGGEPIRSSTVNININVIDANDNFPVFSQQSYKASISEGAENNSIVLLVKATDKDEGSHSQITYSFSSISESALNTFSLDPDTGEIKVKGRINFEHTKSYKMVVKAKDGGGLVAHAGILIEVIDENDNAPEITFTFVTSPIPENSSVGTVVALINVNDEDSGNYGHVECHVQDNVPFTLISSSKKYYKLVTSGSLDREADPEYNITVTATDKGLPPLATTQTIRLELSDINDNPPSFDKLFYQVYVHENNPPGASIYCLKASDVDRDENSRITYSLNSHLGELPLTSYISINSQTGVIYAQRSYDYEQIKEFEFQVRGQDSGSPPLSSNVTVRVFIVDRNDNPPEILYPALESDGSVLFEMVPPSSEEGYLVTKAVAVDADSGHNAWLTFHLLQSSDSPLFKIGLHTGEIRTLRAFLEKDLLKHKVVVMVKDNGQPPLSATVTLNMVFSENMQDVIPELNNQPQDSDQQPQLEVYLVIALSVISFLFFISLMLVVIIKCRKPKGLVVLDSLNPALYTHIDPRLSSNYHNGTLPLPFSYEIAAALDSGTNESTFLKSSQEVPADIIFTANDSGMWSECLGGTISNESTKQVRNAYDVTMIHTLPMLYH
ncbi:hypothetical protein NDU88_006466 [Pleurodeles waltl]|uniref:Cadherin domain-containing protein n=1 Tax=Pleurodeles waltl TaxID=8319 RepID=A0AAV7PIX1_PLEWA|nr:hypothetical protein NDU88_006466 [Pleurodeles waltl]